MRKADVTQQEIMTVLKSRGGRQNSQGCLSRSWNFRGHLRQLESEIGGVCKLMISWKLKELENENHHLKPMFAEVNLENWALEEVIEKKR